MKTGLLRALAISTALFSVCTRMKGPPTLYNANWEYYYSRSGLHELGALTTKSIYWR